MYITGQVAADMLKVRPRAELCSLDRATDGHVFPSGKAIDEVRHLNRGDGKDLV